MACPFFMPMEKFEDGTWPHPARLPLGCGWRGTCAAPGHEGEVPSPDELREFCNLGYAEGCSRLPLERAWDAVRFAVVAASRHESERDNTPGGKFRLRYVCERGNLPAEHGTLEFNVAESRWVRPHADRRVQQMAECFLKEFLNRGKVRDAVRVAS